MILGEGAWGSSASGDGLIPKELRQYGFNQSKVLLWTVGFRRLAGISPGVQVRLESDPAELFRRLNFELISRSRVQVVIVCDKRAERIMFKDNPYIKPVTLQLQNRKVEAWVETRKQKRGCTYLASPAPVVMLWSSSWAQVAKFSAILRFSVIIAGIQGIRTGACASQLVTLQIIRQYDWERLGNVKMTPRTLDPSIRSWLDVKGFNDNDIERLGSCAKSLTAALLMLLKCQAQSKHGKNEGLKVSNSQKRSHNKMDVEHLDNVRELWAEVCSRNPIAGSSHHISSMSVSARTTPVELDLVDGETINVQQELEKDRIESAAITVSGKIVEMHTSANIDFAYRSRKEARSMSMKRPSENLRTQMELLQGVHKAGVHFHSRNRLRTYATPWLPLYIMYRDFQKRFPDVSAVKKAIIKAEIKDDGEKHPQKWACDALERDPAGRLAFWVLLVADEQQLGLYVTCEGDRAAKRANTFVDWMAGVSVEEIVRRPRRSVTFQINSPMLYTDDQGDVIPQARKKSRQEPSE
ncbi:hypothetical protein N8T08_003741 [Aspergillus melleus]|uniref:Uncharacterized protein n=1 Tax=Aspergillus melleus TaxID=138277 RepID=A0ACC3B704_9EURO|nr:hypothetical protein N8T08_003741 [Aspergillus melleus]